MKNKPVAHTPTPWRLLEGTYNNGCERKIISSDRNSSLYILVGGSDEIRNQNAALVVRAVNAHEELLDSAKRSLPLLKHLEKFLKYQTANKQFYPNREQSDTTILLLEQAIAKAEGK